MTRAIALIWLAGIVLMAGPVGAGDRFVARCRFGDKEKSLESKLLFCPGTDSGPELDGKLTDDCWKKIKAYADFVLYRSDGEKAENQTSVRIIHDDQNVYIGCRCRLQDMNAIKAEIAQGSETSRVWCDDNLDIFFFIPHDRAVYQLMINSNAGRFDTRNRSDGWNGEWQAVCSRDDVSWTAELAVPLAALNVRSTVEGKDIIRFNIGRCATTTTGVREVSCLLPGYANPERMGKMVLGSRAARDRYLAGNPKYSMALGLTMEREIYTGNTGLLRLRLDNMQSTPLALDALSLTLSAVPEGGDEPVAQDSLRNLRGSMADISLDLTDLVSGGNYRLLCSVERKSDNTVLGSAHAAFSMKRTVAARNGRIPIKVLERGDLGNSFPVTVGIPFPQGVLVNGDRCRLVDVRLGEETGATLGRLRDVLFRQLPQQLV